MTLTDAIARDSVVTVLVTVKYCVASVVPTTVPVHVRAPGEIVRDVVPVPVSGITSEGTLESLAIVTEPFNCPAAVGMKVVVKVHEAPGASAIPVVTQVPPEILKLPVMEMLLMLTAVEIWLFNVMVAGALVVPTSW